MASQKENVEWWRCVGYSEDQARKIADQEKVLTSKHDAGFDHPPRSMKTVRRHRHGGLARLNGNQSSYLEAIGASPEKVAYQILPLLFSQSWGGDFLDKIVSVIPIEKNGDLVEFKGVDVAVGVARLDTSAKICKDDLYSLDDIHMSSIWLQSGLKENLADKIKNTRIHAVVSKARELAATRATVVVGPSNNLGAIFRYELLSALDLMEEKVGRDGNWWVVMSPGFLRRLDLDLKSPKTPRWFYDAIFDAKRYVGTYMGMWNVYLDELAADGEVTVGRRGESGDDAGLAYCPYLLTMDVAKDGDAVAFTEMEGFVAPEGGGDYFGTIDFV